MTAMQVINSGRFCQESYETASGDAKKRGTELRKLGYDVTVGSIGPQVTPLGVIRITLVTVHAGVNCDTFGLPEVTRVDWPR